MARTLTVEDWNKAAEAWWASRGTEDAHKDVNPLMYVTVKDTVKFDLDAPDWDDEYAKLAARTYYKAYMDAYEDGR